MIEVILPILEVIFVSAFLLYLDVCIIIIIAYITQANTNIIPKTNNFLLLTDKL